MVLLLIQLFAPATLAQTGIVRVESTGTDSPDCGSVAKPCQTIQQAVNIAKSGDTIRIAQGTYTGSGKAVVSLVASEQQPKNLTLTGGYRASNWDTPTLDPSKTVIDGQNGRRGLFIRNSIALVTVENLTIQNGLLTDGLLFDTLDAYFGAGLFCINSPMSLANVTIKNNVVKRQNSQGNELVGGGGAAFYRNCAVTMKNVIFSDNQVIGGSPAANGRGETAIGGGFVATTNSNVTADNLTLTRNRLQAGNGGTGSQDATGYLRADALGGGAAFFESQITLKYINVSENNITAGQGSAFGGFGDGAGLYFEKLTSALVKQGVIKNNLVHGGASSDKAGEGEGGAIMSSEASLTLEQLWLVNNQAIGGAGRIAGRANGGGLCFIASQVTGTNLVIADNIAHAGTGEERWGGGGGIYLSRQTQLTLNHTTLAGNSVLDSMIASGGVVVDSSTMNINYSIIADHTQGYSALAALSSSDTLNINYTLFSGNIKDFREGQAGKVVNTNAQTGLPSFADTNYHLKVDSAAINKAVGSSTLYDIDGQTRPHDGLADVGADEYYLLDQKIYLPLIVK